MYKKYTYNNNPLLFHDKCPGFFYVHYTTHGTYSFTSHPKDEAIMVKCHAQGHKRRDWPGRDSYPHSGNTRTWVQCTGPLGHDTLYTGCFNKKVIRIEGVHMPMLFILTICMWFTNYEALLISAFHWNLSYIIAVTHDRVHCYWNRPLQIAFLQVWVIDARQDNRWKSVLMNKIFFSNEGYLLTLPFYAPTHSTFPPPLSTQSWQRRSMSWTARLTIAGSLRKASTSWRTRPRNSSRSWGGVANTLFFKCAPKK